MSARPGASVAAYGPSDVPEQNMDGSSGLPGAQRYMINAFGCCFMGADLNNIMLCSKGEAELCCLTHEHCLAANHDQLGIGMLGATNQECCKLGCFCCTLGCKPPQRLCRGAMHTWCCVQANSFPLDPDYVGDHVAAFCGYQCMPETGCCNPYPSSPALENIEAYTTPLSDVMTRD